MERMGLCTVASCKQPAVTTLSYQEFCLAHFITHCYQRLDDGNWDLLRSSKDLHEAASLRQFLVECSRRTLDICLAGQDLDNVQRARLLDILLWASDIASGRNARDAA